MSIPTGVRPSLWNPLQCGDDLCKCFPRLNLYLRKGTSFVFWRNFRIYSRHIRIIFKDFHNPMDDTQRCVNEWYRQRPIIRPPTVDRPPQERESDDDSLLSSDTPSLPASGNASPLHVHTTNIPARKLRRRPQRALKEAGTDSSDDSSSDGDSGSNWSDSDASSTSSYSHEETDHTDAFVASDSESQTDNDILDCSRGNKEARVQKWYRFKEDMECHIRRKYRALTRGFAHFMEARGYRFTKWQKRRIASCHMVVCRVHSRPRPHIIIQKHRVIMKFSAAVLYREKVLLPGRLRTCPSGECHSCGKAALREMMLWGISKVTAKPLTLHVRTEHLRIIANNMKKDKKYKNINYNGSYRNSNSDSGSDDA